ncbi:MAG: bifunctional phosphopantothenoylcysteine decarboxylase/phosphopantothenate--cysteine ligase CoaBC [Microbacteriaceae bacterium]
MSSRRIIVGVSGGIAAYKALSLIRLLVKNGDEVQVVATDSALNFIGQTSFEALSRNPLETELFRDVAEVKHVALGQRCDALVVVPATANTLAKFANGLADDLLTNTFLTTHAPVLVAPAMHTEMWQNQATQANVALLKSRGIHFVGPAEGELTGADSGIGRMSEPEDIFDALQGILNAEINSLPLSDYSSRRVLITAGGTREALDPVRFLGNRSSGKQGLALAIAAQQRGAQVTLIAANLEVPIPAGIHTVSVQSAQEMQQALQRESPKHDLVIMAAAVADYRPEEVSTSKIKKDAQGEELVIRFLKNPDLLAGLVRDRLAGQVIVGFAAETASGEELIQLGRSKLQSKGCDFLVVNQVSWEKGFSQDDNQVTVLSQGGAIVGEGSGSKAQIAQLILDILKS